MIAMNIEEKFLYVFDELSRDKLLKAGLQLIASYDKKKVFIFANDRKMTFSLDGISYFPSNKLTF